MSADNGGPAFPTDNEAQTGPNTWHHSGMTLRDYFAAKAMQGFCASEYGGVMPPSGSGENWQDATARTAYEIADAMLRARDGV